MNTNQDLSDPSSQLLSELHRELTAHVLDIQHCALSKNPDIDKILESTHAMNDTLNTMLTVAFNRDELIARLQEDTYKEIPIVEVFALAMLSIIKQFTNSKYNVVMNECHLQRAKKDGLVSNDITLADWITSPICEQYITECHGRSVMEAKELRISNIEKIFAWFDKWLIGVDIYGNWPDEKAFSENGCKTILLTNVFKKLLENAIMNTKIDEEKRISISYRLHDNLVFIKNSGTTLTGQAGHSYLTNMASKLNGTFRSGVSVYNETQFILPKNLLYP